MRLEDVGSHRPAHVSVSYEADPCAAGGQSAGTEEGEKRGVRGAAENTGARATPGASSANTHLRVEAAARRAGSAACSILCMEFVLSLSII